MKPKLAYADDHFHDECGVFGVFGHPPLLHVADGWAARNYNRFELADSEEMKTMRPQLRFSIAGRNLPELWPATAKI